MIGVTNKDVLLLKKCIYGLVQAARQYHKKAVEILKNIGFSGGTIDPCLFLRENKSGLVLITLYVDDNLMIGHSEAIEETITQLKENGLVLKVENELTDYLSCKIKFTGDNTRAWLGQPHLIANLEKKFGDKVKNLRVYKTPGTPGVHQVRELDAKLAIGKKEQTEFRSGVGMLLYLVKHSRPDIANSVRELSKVLDGSTSHSFKEMLRVIKYVLDTKNLGLKIFPNLDNNEQWELTCYTDSDYAGDPETRRSVSGYILYVKNVPVCWCSKAQRAVTLSSSEAEWYALSEATKEIIFVLQLLESIHIKVRLPIIVRVDNVGAIFLSGNINTASRSKHIDIRTNYVNEYVEDGVLKIVFVKSADNTSDMMTKNLGGELHVKHSSGLVTSWKGK